MEVELELSEAEEERVDTNDVHDLILQQSDLFGVGTVELLCITIYIQHIESLALTTICHAPHCHAGIHTIIQDLKIRFHSTVNHIKRAARA